jgi:competence protein ComEA
MTTSIDNHFSTSSTGRWYRACLALGLLLAMSLSPVLAPAAAAQEAPPPAVVNINTADATTLSTMLTGVGPSKADAIVRYRETYGPFGSVEELAEVRGIGQSTLDRNRDRITLE